MTWELTTAEKKAIEAQALPSFPINVEEIRRTVSQLLSEFGRYGFFDEYTVHSFDHVHEMLKCLDWLVPFDSHPLLSKGDWLILTLACYFHDLGLLITRDEFENRNQSGFNEFCDKILFSGPDGPDYRAKVNELNQTESEKFLYQEFVRYNHAARVRAWIMGKPNVALGQAQAAADEVNRLLAPLDERIRIDLANVCESHNLNDLDDEQKYPLFQPYGGTEDETVNLQYAAVMLRTTDLIQITRQRAPTVLFKTINPTDPISQIEWLKQNAVRHIRSKPRANRSGEVSKEIQSDTVEVYADFRKADGFFGLTAYLQYAERELQQSYSVIEKSKKKLAKKYSFPWRYIDDSHIKTEGFLPQKYGFELDQARILDLLTGHTLYNDSAVVIRELAQNAIDAVRLQASEEGSAPERVGKVEIKWDSQKMELEVVDNGTGMTQEVIEKHLLKVGSSRYQDEKFKEEHPNFSPISRFGIGVLSAFMVADAVEIITCSPLEDCAREISLRSVHGKYLIRLLDKNADHQARQLAPHGTKIKLKLRASAKKTDVLRVAAHWIVFPRCKVTVVIDSGEPVRIGFNSPKSALEDYLTTVGPEHAGEYKIEERTDAGVTLAYALRSDPLYHDWTFTHLRGAESKATIPLGTCVEGVRVEFGTPGFRESTFLAIANATGVTAPKTNVARSSLEDTAERMELIRKLYELYREHIEDEAKRLFDIEKIPLSRIMSQIPFIGLHPVWLTPA